MALRRQSYLKDSKLTATGVCETAIRNGRRAPLSLHSRRSTFAMGGAIAAIVLAVNMANLTWAKGVLGWSR